MKLPPMRTFMNEDRYVRAKHTTIYPSAEQLEGVQNMVSHMECGLKAVSEWLNKKETEAAGAGAGATERCVFYSDCGIFDVSSEYNLLNCRSWLCIFIVLFFSMQWFVTE